MSDLVRIFEGEDLIIPHHELEGLGIRPGEAVIIRPQVELRPTSMTASEKQRRIEVLEQLYGVWTPEDEIAFETLRRQS